MKFTPHQYAASLLEVLEGEPAKHADTIRCFKKLLQKNGAEKKIKEIILAAENINLKKAGGRRVKTRAASEESLKILKNKFKVADEIKEIVDKNLYGGAEVTIDGLRADTTIHHRLTKVRLAFGLSPTSTKTLNPNN